MKISAKTDYALKALLELSLHWPKVDPLQINVIARNQKIPMKFLIHIMIQLKQIGFVHSLRGNKGGYLLAKSPKDILLSDVLNQFGELDINAVGKSKSKNRAALFETIWSEADSALFGYFSNINFDELVRRTRSMDSVSMYSI